MSGSRLRDNHKRLLLGHRPTYILPLTGASYECLQIRRNSHDCACDRRQLIRQDIVLPLSTLRYRHCKSYSSDSMDHDHLSSIG
jgi:hypothetical protein